MVSRLTSIARPARSSVVRAAGGNSSCSIVIRWLGASSAVRSNQNTDSAVSTRPLSGMGVGMMTSKALIRSDATISIVSPKLYISRTLPEASCRLASWSDTLHLQDVEGALEDLVHVAQEAIEVEHPVERGGVEQGGGLGVRLQQAPERHLLTPGAKGLSRAD